MLYRDNLIQAMDAAARRLSYVGQCVSSLVGSRRFCYNLANGGASCSLRNA